jgi:DNA-binding NarL/FixJ family response regulator
VSQDPIRVLLVEDNDVYRDSLVFLLDRYESLDVVGAVGDGSSAAAACAELEPDVVVLDYRLPDLGGEEVAGELRERCPGAAIVFLSASAGSEEIEAARRSGAAFVAKDEGVETLVGAVRAAAGRIQA